MTESNSPSHDVSSRKLVVNSDPAPELAYVVNLSEQHKRVRINKYAKTELISTIKSELSKADWNRLSNGCLNYIIRMGDNLATHSQVMHQMLLRRVQTDKEKELWFKVDGRLMRFSLLEFCCVTGLKCAEDNLDLGPPKHVSVSSYLGIPRYTLHNLVDYFVSTPKDSPKKLVLAKWIVIEGVILPHRGPVKDELLSLACDRERFEHYPWGRQSYLHLIKSLKKVCRTDTKSANHRYAYNVLGFPLAFQMWIFEAIPSIPRFLNCSFTRVKSGPGFSLQWASDAKNNLFGSKRARSLFATPLGTIHSLYAEFMTEHGLHFTDEVADPIIDSFVKDFVDADDTEEPSNSARKLRMHFHAIKEKKRGLPSNEADDFEAPITKKAKHKHARGKTATDNLALQAMFEDVDECCQPMGPQSDDKFAGGDNEANVAMSEDVDEGCQPIGPQSDDELPGGDKNDAPDVLLGDEADVVTPVGRQSKQGSKHESLVIAKLGDIMEVLQTVVQRLDKVEELLPCRNPCTAQVSQVDQTTNKRAPPDPAPVVYDDIEPTNEADDTSVGKQASSSAAVSDAGQDRRGVDGCVQMIADILVQLREPFSAPVVRRSTRSHSRPVGSLPGSLKKYTRRDGRVVRK